MLHDILLSLSGHPSPLLQGPASGHGPQDKTVDVLSPPESALLSSLAHLGSLHRRLLALTAAIAASHPSTVCRAVSAAVVATHLARFQDKILEVERGILDNDAGLVGGYGIVPLSRVVGEFDAWVRPMEWLWKAARFMQPDDDSEKSSPGLARCTGAAIMNHLRDEAQTGYPDIEAIALDLVRVAEAAWLRQLSTWLLYGRLPVSGDADFMVQRAQDDAPSETDTPEYTTSAALTPRIVTPATAASILFVGKSLNRIRARGSALAGAASASTAPELALLPTHLRHLAALSSPISAASLAAAVAAIRASLSRNTLQQLLPLPRILGVLSVLRDYFLLERGEFAVALITEADEQARARWRRPGQAPADRGAEKLASALIKDGEVAAVLARAWATLASFQSDEDEGDDAEDLARDLLQLAISKPPVLPVTPRAQSDGRFALADVQFNDLLLSVPTTLSLHVSPPLDLFLSARDLDIYAAIHAYLLSIRRGHLRLTHLWTRSSLRRDHPAPTGPPRSNTRAGQASLEARRVRANARARAMRRTWATSGAAAFLLSAVGEHFQGEVVRGASRRFLAWLGGTDASSSGGTQPSEGGDDIWTASTAPAQPPEPATARAPHDPETLSAAHRRYLTGLARALLLTDEPFTRTLRGFLRSLDHLVGCVGQVDAAQRALDLESDAGVVDADVDAAADERRALRALAAADADVHAGLTGLVARLRQLDAQRERGPAADRTAQGDSAGAAAAAAAAGGGGGEGQAEAFVPWTGPGVDRLCMKLDFGSFVTADAVDGAGGAR